MKFYGKTDVGVCRTENQDCFGIYEILPGVTLLAVCDGMGGMAGGAVASRLALDTFVASMREHIIPDNPEDEPDLDKVHFLPEMFKVYARGFVKGCGGALTEKEISMLPLGGYMLTLETGIRFLTDYLDGDVYFHTDYADHNLVRARTQFKLVAETETYMEELQEFVKGLC